MAGRGTALTRRRVANRPRLRSHLDDVQATTKSQYDLMIAQLDAIMLLLGGVTVDTLLAEGEMGAVRSACTFDATSLTWAPLVLTHHLWPPQRLDFLGTLWL